MSLFLSVKWKPSIQSCTHFAFTEGWVEASPAKTLSDGTWEPCCLLPVCLSWVRLQSPLPGLQGKKPGGPPPVEGDPALPALREAAPLLLAGHHPIQTAGQAQGP